MVATNNGNVQWNMNLQTIAPIYTYAAYKMHENKQTSMANIYKYDQYICLQGSIYAYMNLHIHIYGDIYP